MSKSKDDDGNGLAIAQIFGVDSPSAKKPKSVAQTRARDEKDSTALDVQKIKDEHQELNAKHSIAAYERIATVFGDMLSKKNNGGIPCGGNRYILKADVASYRKRLELLCFDNQVRTVNLDGTNIVVQYELHDVAKNSLVDNITMTCVIKIHTSARERYKVDMAEALKCYETLRPRVTDSVRKEIADKYGFPALMDPSLDMAGSATNTIFHQIFRLNRSRLRFLVDYLDERDGTGMDAIYRSRKTAGVPFFYAPPKRPDAVEKDITSYYLLEPVIMTEQKIKEYCEKIGALLVRRLDLRTTRGYDGFVECNF